MMFIGVDGTGAADNDEYAQETRNSFVHRLVSQTSCQPAIYLRGPSLLGMEVESIARNVYDLAVQRQRVSGNTDIALAGWSRGGASVVWAAHMLHGVRQQTGIRIVCMALFDAVDRTTFTDYNLDIIPDNVENAYHAKRDPRVMSRWYFGNCGTEHAIPANLSQRTFYATHAGVGGVPWTGDHPSIPVPYTGVSVPTINEQTEREQSEAVRMWMWGNLRRHGFFS